MQEDVWALPTSGAADDFRRLAHVIAAGDPSRGSSRPVRMLWAIRWNLGKLLGWWDRPDASPNYALPSVPIPACSSQASPEATED
jgi:hypothetical protein